MQSVASFGGFAPFIATWLISATGSPLSPAYCVIAAAVVSFVVNWQMPETAHRELGRYSEAAGTVEPSHFAPAATELHRSCWRLAGDGSNVFAFGRVCGEE
jgi:hypothetical protein